MDAKKKFLQAYDNYSAPVLRHIFFRVSERALAEDLTQETFFRVWKSIANGNEEIKNLKAFIYKVANNLVVDHYRQSFKKTVSIDEIDPSDAAIGATQEKETDASLAGDLVLKYLDELDEDYRQVLFFRYVDDLKIKEISDVTGKTPGNVSVMIYRGIKMLKEKIVRK